MKSSEIISSKFTNTKQIKDAKLNFINYLLSDISFLTTFNISLSCILARIVHSCEFAFYKKCTNFLLGKWTELYFKGTNLHTLKTSLKWRLILQPRQPDTCCRFRWHQDRERSLGHKNKHHYGLSDALPQRVLTDTHSPDNKDPLQKEQQH